jgi:hypothetical protein
MLVPAVILQYSHLRPTVYTYVATYQPEDDCRTTTWAQEYMPIWVKACISKKTKIPLVKTLNNQTKITNIQVLENGRNIRFTTNGKKDSIIIGKYFFPGWVVSYDSGKNSQIVPYGKNGLISFEIPNGVHKITVQFKNTPGRLISNTISLVSFVILVFFIVFTFLSRHGNHKVNKKNT